MKEIFLTVALGILILAAVGVLVASSIIIIGCPPRPTMQTDFAVISYYEGTRRISFHATASAAENFEGFGRLYDDGIYGGYDLYVDPRYDFQEVLDYLKAWDGCHEEEEE